LIGGEGEDDLKGEDGNDVLVGGNAKDKLEGGDDDDVLIGGNGADDLDGGNGDDILIGSATSWEQDWDALIAIHDIWVSSDSLQGRMDQLNGDFFASGTQVLNDNYTDKKGANWLVESAEENGSSTAEDPAPEEDPVIPTDPVTPTLITSSYVSQSTDVTIADNDVTLASLTIEDSITIEELTLTMQLTHEKWSELSVVLISPEGTRIDLDISAGSNGTIFEPAGDLSVVNSQSAQGQWILELTDAKKRKTGVLNSWSLDVSHG